MSLSAAWSAPRTRQRACRSSRRSARRVTSSATRSIYRMPVDETADALEDERCRERALARMAEDDRWVTRLYAPRLRAEARLSTGSWRTRELVAIVSIMALAAVLRFWDLGAMALHHDESLHAQLHLVPLRRAGLRAQPADARAVPVPLRRRWSSSSSATRDHTTRYRAGAVRHRAGGHAIPAAQADRHDGGDHRRRAADVLADAALLQPLLPQRHLHRRLDLGAW